MSSDPLPPFTQADGGFAVNLTDDEAAMVLQLTGELRRLLSEPDDEATALVRRLFPTVHADDPEAEAEYQRLMRDDLVQSKLASIDTVESMLARSFDVEGGDPNPAGTLVSEADMVAWMQAINSIRLVLGTMLEVSDDPDGPEVMPGFEHSQEYYLYEYLSWLLNAAVEAVSGDSFG